VLTSSLIKLDQATDAGFMLPAGPVTWQYDISKESHLSVTNTSLERQAKSQELSLGISPKLVVSMRNKRREEYEELVLTSP